MQWKVSVIVLLYLLGSLLTADPVKGDELPPYVVCTAYSYLSADGQAEFCNSHLPTEHPDPSCECSWAWYIHPDGSGHWECDSYWEEGIWEVDEVAGWDFEDYESRRKVEAERWFKRTILKCEEK